MGLKLANMSLYQQELVKLTIEKQEQPSPTTPNKPAPPAATTVERLVHSVLLRNIHSVEFIHLSFYLYSNVPSEVPSIEREQEVSSKTDQTPPPVETASDVPDEEVAPPKPPLPEAKMAELR